MKSKMHKSLIIIMFFLGLSAITGCCATEHVYIKIQPIESVGEKYQRDIVPELRKYVSEPALITQKTGSAYGSYTITANGKTYLINEQNPTMALFEIVNRQLENTSYCMIAIYDSHDAYFTFMKKSEWAAWQKENNPHIARMEGFR